MFYRHVRKLFKWLILFRLLICIEEPFTSATIKRTFISFIWGSTEGRLNDEWRRRILLKSHTTMRLATANFFLRCEQWRNFPFLTSHTCHYLFTFVNRMGRRRRKKEQYIFHLYVKHHWRCYWSDCKRVRFVYSHSLYGSVDLI